MVDSEVLYSSVSDPDQVDWMDSFRCIMFEAYIREVFLSLIIVF